MTRKISFHKVGKYRGESTKSVPDSNKGRPPQDSRKFDGVMEVKRDSMSASTAESRRESCGITAGDSCNLDDVIIAGMWTKFRLLVEVNRQRVLSQSTANQRCILVDLTPFRSTLTVSSLFKHSLRYTTVPPPAPARIVHSHVAVQRLDVG